MESNDTSSRSHPVYRDPEMTWIRRVKIEICYASELWIWFEIFPAMKHLLLYSIAMILISACSEDRPQGSSTEMSPELEQFLSHVDEKPEPHEVPRQAPSSLSGSERYSGSDPHAELGVEQHIAVASQHASEGRMAEALDIITRAIIDNPDDPSLIGTRGSLLLAQDRVFDAQVDLEKAVSLAPHSPELLINRSQAYLKFDRSQEAMDDLNKAVALNPELVPARFNRGVMLYGEARYEEALADFDVCIQVAPETAGPYFNRAVTRDALGDQAGAVSDMNKFIELSDNPEWNKIARETMATWEQAAPSKEQVN